MGPVRRASLWSSCVVLPLLALTWMSAVLAVTDRRSALFQILFAIFDSLEGFVIVMVHCVLRREVGGRALVSAGSLGCWAVSPAQREPAPCPVLAQTWGAGLGAPSSWGSRVFSRGARAGFHPATPQLPLVGSGD